MLLSNSRAAYSSGPAIIYVPLWSPVAQLGRGLHIFKPVAGLASRDASLREVRPCEIDVFEPNEALRGTSEVFGLAIWKPRPLNEGEEPSGNRG